MFISSERKLAMEAFGMEQNGAVWGNFRIGLFYGVALTQSLKTTTQQDSNITLKT